MSAVPPGDWTAEKMAEGCGRGVVFALFLVGAVRTLLVMSRPTANKKCLLSLVLVLVAWVLLCVAVEVKHLQPGLGGLINLLAVLVGICLLIAGLVLAIVGLVEFVRSKGVYKEGRGQAIISLVLVLSFLGWVAIGLARS